MPLTKAKKHQIIRESEGRCFLCGLPMIPGTETIHHVLPRARGGTNAADNLVAVHATCNLQVGDRLPTSEEFERLLRLKGISAEEIPRDSVLRKLLRYDEEQKLG